MESTSSYRDMYASILRRYRGYPENYSAMLRSIEPEVDLQRVHSCVTIGPGAGKYEIEFIERFMPNLRTLTAVEPDSESQVEMKANMERQLPKLETSFHQMTLDAWKGPGQSVDVVLMFHVLYFVPIAELPEFFKDLYHKWLTPRGFAFVVHESRYQSAKCIGEVKRRLNSKYDEPYDEDIKRSALEVGFQLEMEPEFHTAIDLSDPDDDLLGFFQFEIKEESISLDKIRETIDEVRPVDQFTKLMVFRK
jgi:hypothetical protein